jgi:hypothetical protein
MGWRKAKVETKAHGPTPGVDYPVPVKIKDSYLGVDTLGWKGHPYSVEVSKYDETYLKIIASKGYRSVKAREVGFIFCSDDTNKVAKTLKVFLAEAWRLGQDPTTLTASANVDAADAAVGVG